MAQRLTDKEVLILNMLVSSNSEMYGLTLVKQSGGVLKRGSVYLTLANMEKKGYLTSRRESEIPRNGFVTRRLYKPTDVGTKTLHEHEADIK